MDWLIFFIIVSFIFKFLKKGNLGQLKQEYKQLTEQKYDQIPKDSGIPQSVFKKPEASKKKAADRIFETAAPRDKLTLYHRFITTDRYTDLEKIGHEMGISKYQAAREIMDLQNQGYFKYVSVDENNWELVYRDTPARQASEKADLERANAAKDLKTGTTTTTTRTTSSSGKTTTSASTVASPQAKEDSSHYIQRSAPYVANRNAAERYEEWFPIPSGKQILTCKYCGASNAIPAGSEKSRYTCYFCREEL